MKSSRPLRILAIAGAVWLVGYVSNRFLPGTLLGAIQDVGALVFLGASLYYLGSLLARLVRKILWRIRNKLILSFAFVGGIPVLLLLLMTGAVAGLIFKRLSGFYLEHELNTLTRSVARACDEVRLAYFATPETERGDVVDHLPVAYREVPLGLRNLGLLIYRRGESGWEFDDESPRPPELEPPKVLPGWLEADYSGFTLREGALHFIHVTDLGDRVRLVADLPLDERVLDYLERRTSIQLALTLSNPTTNPDEFSDILQSIAEAGETLSVRWVHFFTPVAWTSGRATQPCAMVMNVPFRSLFDFFFAQDAGALLLIILVLGIAFVVVELLSLAVGIGLARSITHTINALDEAVQRIRDGDFSFKIPTRGRDQLEAVAESFNEMCSSVTRLMQEVSQREWLAKEVEIAREVQNLLFPHKLPEVPGLQVAASCRPARQVSGDFYDFLVYGATQIDVVVGDIAGKGISAALLMASLQASIRSALGETAAYEDPAARLSEVLARLNRQLYQRTAPEAYSTLVLAHLDLEEQRIYYGNAGHHPPLLVTSGQVVPLTPGGTVVGLFESAVYSSGMLPLCEGDLVAFFTDGVVEAENADGEEFGTERLIELLRANTFLTAEDLRVLIQEAVDEWTGDGEPDDDVTVVILKLESS
ncbi:MAG: hypothetical protein Kow00109_23320 [Acidobacteriota bacterium]